MLFLYGEELREIVHDGGVNRIPKGRRFDGRKSRMVITFMVRLRLTLRATVRKGDDGEQRITSEELVGFLTSFLRDWVQRLFLVHSFDFKMACRCSPATSEF